MSTCVRGQSVALRTGLKEEAPPANASGELQLPHSVQRPLWRMLVHLQIVTAAAGVLPVNAIAAVATIPISADFAKRIVVSLDALDDARFGDHVIGTRAPSDRTSVPSDRTSVVYRRDQSPVEGYAWKDIL